MRIFPFNAEYQLDSAISLNGSVDAPPEDGEDTWYRTNRYTWTKRAPLSESMNISLAIQDF